MSIPVKAAKKLAEEHGLQQVIIFAWDGSQTHVVTYGDTVEACAVAAAGANKIKQGWAWPEELLAEPSRVKSLQDRIKVLEKENKALNKRLEIPPCDGSY